VTLDPSSKARLTPFTAERFAGNTLFDRIARAVCRAGCLPRKELYESWEVAKRVRRYFKGGRIIDLAAGHGLLAHALMLLDSESTAALAVDTRKPPCADKVAGALAEDWPKLAGAVTFIETSLDTLPFDLSTTDLIVSAHACGALTDRVLELAIAARAKVAVLPCCHDLRGADLAGLGGWLDGPLAIDVERAHRLTRAGYEIRTMEIPPEISPKNRLLIGAPRASLSPASA
jgi:hypothetical protein